MNTLLEPTSGFASSAVRYWDEAYIRWEHQQQKYEASREEIREWARKHGNALKGTLPATSQAFHKPWTEEESLKLREMRAKGYSFEDCGEELGRSGNSCLSRWQREGAK
jgi:uncharacterized protein (DUF927 family)